MQQKHKRTMILYVFSYNLHFYYDIVLFTNICIHATCNNTFYLVPPTIDMLECITKTSGGWNILDGTHATHPKI